MAQVIIKKEFIKKEIVKNCVGAELFELSLLPENKIEKEDKNDLKKEQKNLKKINKTLLKIAKKSKYNNNFLNAIIPFKAVKQKLGYRNFAVY